MLPRSLAALLAAPLVFAPSVPSPPAPVGAPFGELAAAPVRQARHAEFVVQGTVRSRDGARPIAGATVTAAEQPTAATTTGADGRYRLVLTLATGTRTVTLTVRAAGYALRTQPVPVTWGGATVDVVLGRIPAAPPMPVADAAAVGGQASKAVGIGERREVHRATMPSLHAAPLAVSSEALPPHRRRPAEPWNREQYAVIDENPFRAPAVAPRSTFAIDVDRASYANVRRFLLQDQRPPRDAVRIEELVNYFAYDYPAPPTRPGGEPIAATIETHPAPWQPAHRLVRIGLQAQRIPVEALPPANLVFLIDVSGSMQAPNKLPLVRESLRLLVRALRPQDRVAIVVYAGAAGLVLPPTPGSERRRIEEALDRLEAGGSTNGAAGIRLAYRTAREAFVAAGANRVILATDGDFNVGTTSDAELVQLIEGERRSGVFLTVLGFGMGNLQDAKMEQLADRGNGQYAYIDDLAEAQKALVREMGGTLFTLAKDVKVQVEFNPARVRAWRLLGYENRLLRDEDFVDDTKDAGELGAGHAVTALYEVALVGAPSPVAVREVPPSRYGTGGAAPAGRAGARDELAWVQLRWQPPTGGASRLAAWPAVESRGVPSADWRFASAVAGFGMLLRGSPHAGALTWDEVRRLGHAGLGEDRDGDRAEFLRLVDRAERVTGPQVAARRDER